MRTNEQRVKDLEAIIADPNSTAEEIEEARIELTAGPPDSGPPSEQAVIDRYLEAFFTGEDLPADTADGRGRALLNDFAYEVLGGFDGWDGDGSAARLAAAARATRSELIQEKLGYFTRPNVPAAAPAPPDAEKASADARRIEPQPEPEPARVPTEKPVVPDVKPKPDPRPVPNYYYGRIQPPDDSERDRLNAFYRRMHDEALTAEQRRSAEHLLFDTLARSLSVGAQQYCRFLLALGDWAKRNPGETVVLPGERPGERGDDINPAWLLRTAELAAQQIEQQRQRERYEAQQRRWESSGTFSVLPNERGTYD